MQMLLRTRPENLEDLTIEVALVRPGPIQGGAVHPYIAHREARRRDPSFEPPVDHPLLAEPLRDTLGVVVFQDQVLEVAMALAGFSVGEAEALRRAMSRKRSAAALEALRERFVEGALANGVELETAHRVYDKLAAFSGFGFPKSHAVAFALLAYQSAWLRRYYPAEFLCALMNAQPMGFYPPATLVRDGQRRGVEVLTPDVNRSAVRCEIRDGRVVVGLGYVRTVGEADAEVVVSERERGGPFASVLDLARRAPLPGDRLAALVSAGACDSFGRPRRELIWELGLVPRSMSVGRLSTARSGSSRSRSIPPQSLPTCRSRPSGNECSPTTAARASRWASTRSSCCARTCRPAPWAAPTSRTCRTAAGWRSRGWWSRASAPRPRTASSSCCSRTSTGTSTSSSRRRSTSGTARSCAESR